MKTFEVRLLARARRDLIALDDYLSRDAGPSSARVVDELLAAIAALSGMPKRCPLVRDPKLRRRGHRVLVCGDYLAFFKIEATQVRVHRVLHARRSYDALLR